MCQGTLPQPIKTTILVPMNYILWLKGPQEYLIPIRSRDEMIRTFELMKKLL